MREFIEIAVRRQESDLAGYSSVRINPTMVYRIDATMEQFALALPKFQKETGLQVESLCRVGVATVEEFGEAMKMDKLARYIADTMPSDDASTP